MKVRVKHAIDIKPYLRGKKLKIQVGDMVIGVKMHDVLFALESAMFRNTDYLELDIDDTTIPGNVYIESCSRIPVKDVI